MPAVLPDDAVEEFFEVFVVALEAAEQDPVVVRQREEGPGHPARGDGHPQLSPAIVIDEADAFKARLASPEAQKALAAFLSRKR